MATTKNEIVFESATSLLKQLEAKTISSVELTETFIQQIEDHDGDINAVVVRRFDQALAEAAAADQVRAKGQAGPLTGLPMTIKESYVMKDTPSTWGIPEYKDNVADEDGLTVSWFRQAGAHFLGKTNVPLDLADFQSYNDIYGTTNNPHDLERTPGGSSGGSGAAMAAGFSGLEAGSDIGGSIRTPAHFSGVYGHKPTWGIVPMAGHALVPGVPDADVSVCGPLARSAEDLRLALDIMAGPTEREAIGWTLNLAPAGIESLKGLRVALWPTDELAPVSRDTEALVYAVGRALEAHGATVSDTARPDFDKLKAHHTYHSLMTATMASAQPESRIAEIQAHVDELDPADNTLGAVNARASVMRHRDWIRHNFRRERFRQEWDRFFGEWDVLICPQTTAPAFKHDHRPFGERTTLVDGEERPYNEALFWSGIANWVYLPSTLFPAGYSSDGLPIGLQATCQSYRDYRAIEVARLITEHIGGFVPPERMTG
jgi:amidase